MQMKFPVSACWLLLPIAVSLTTGCNSIPQNVALGAVIGTGVGAIIPAHDIEQVYYLGSFDPQEQVPPALYRVRVRGQASIISWMKRRMGSDTFSEDLMAALDGLGSFLEL